MKNRGISIKELSIKTGISEPTLKRLRTQVDANPTLDVLLRLSAALQVSVSELIQEQDCTPTFYYGDKNNIANELSEFILVFTKNIFSFKSGGKAIFKKYLSGGAITKYIINNQGKLLERIGDDKWLFQDEEHKNYFINENIISAVILKELYEVNYV